MIIIGEKGYTGQGYGSEAINLISSFAFNQLNLNRRCAYLLNNNPRAKRAFEKAGFSVEGVLISDRFSEGKDLDKYLLARVRDG